MYFLGPLNVKKTLKNYLMTIKFQCSVLGSCFTARKELKRKKHSAKLKHS